VRLFPPTASEPIRFEAMHKTKLPPLFGREEEIELLLRRWRHATQEEGRVVVLTGEPGIGKSHIALALDERLQSEPHITLRYFCSAHHTRGRALTNELCKCGSPSRNLPECARHCAIRVACPRPAR
jgi:AAA ATPase domain